MRTNKQLCAEIHFQLFIYNFIYKINTGKLLLILVLIVQVQMYLGPRAW